MTVRDTLGVEKTAALDKVEEIKLVCSAGTVYGGGGVWRGSP